MGRQEILAAPALDPRFRSHLRLVEPEDAAYIAALRADPALNRHLSPPPESVAAQRDWIEAYKTREAAGREFYFVIRSGGADRGVVRLYDFRDGSFAWGSWIIPPGRPAGLVTFSAVMVYEIGFDALGFDRSHFDVRKGNAGVIAFHLRAGAVEAGETAADRLFTFPRAAWPAFRAASAARIAAHRVLQPE